MVSVAVGRVNAADLDAVTIDAYGTLAILGDPLPRLHELVPAATREDVELAFEAEGTFYAAHVHEGKDADSLAALRTKCVAVFNRSLGTKLSVEDYVGALVFEPLPGVVGALEHLRRLGLSLAVVANWDFGLHDWLIAIKLAGHFSCVVHAAEKPAPEGILAALRTLNIEPSRTLHIGDSAVDEEAAAAAGVHFLPAPLPEAVASLG
jgi:phosphoglycolate phosphatase-like HAD superfamily hydrolase